MNQQQQQNAGNLLTCLEIVDWAHNQISIYSYKHSKDFDQSGQMPVLI